MERQPLSEVIPICTGELRHAIRCEHARTVTDVLARRCRLAMVDQSEAQRLTPVVQELLRSELDTSPGENTPLNLEH